MLTALAQLYARDLAKVCAQLAKYPDEASIWAVQDGLPNSAGTLALHLVGNLNTFIGADLGGVAYTRDREAEFARRSVPRSALLASLTDTSQRVQTALLGLDESQLSQPFPRILSNFPADMTIGHFLLHLYGHLNWHLGQLDYHRRMFALKSV